MQGLCNLLYHEEEREMNPFWSPLARGLLARPWQKMSARGDQDQKTKRWFVGDQNEIIVSRVEELARQRGCARGSVAMSWLSQKGFCPNCWI